MSELTDDPDLALKLLAKLVHRFGGYVKILREDEPQGEFNLMSKVDRINGTIELMLSDHKGEAD